MLIRRKPAVQKARKWKKIVDNSPHASWDADEGCVALVLPNVKDGSSSYYYEVRLTLDDAKKVMEALYERPQYPFVKPIKLG